MLAVDLDPAAIEATVRNAAANRARVEVRLFDAAEAPLSPAGVTVANISLAGVNALRPESPHLVTSGYLEREAPAVAGYEAIRRLVRDGWAADMLVRRTP